MLHHYITKYVENGTAYAEAWLQLNLFGSCFCFCKRRIRIEQCAVVGRLIALIMVDDDGYDWEETLEDLAQSLVKTKRQPVTAG